jgi:hypothetical protein
MPTQAITSRTCRKTVLGAFYPSLVPLNNMVYFPVTTRRITPASICENDRVATEVAVACRLVKNPSEGYLCHLLIMAQARLKWIVTQRRLGPIS